MIRTDDANLLESGHSVVVGTVDAAGIPDATRAWGLWFDGRADTFRVLVPATSERTLDNVRAGRPMAVCTTDVHTLRSIQVKGTPSFDGPATDHDLERHRNYWDAFLANLRQSDGTTDEQLRNLTPATFAAVEVHIESVFDQTPGPLAGEAR